MNERFDWATADDSQDLVHQAVERLYQGQLVLFPTGSTYALTAYAGHPLALKRLAEAPRDDKWTPALGLQDTESCHALSDSIGAKGKRLIERCLPGPFLILLVDQREPQALSHSVRELVVHAGRVAVRVPDHTAILETLRLLPEPLILVDGSRSACDPEGALREFGALANLLIDDGPCPFGKPTTVVDVEGEGVRLLREGVVPASRVERLTAEIITFVCTGNSCRSPMAEAIFRRLLAQELGCSPDDLPDRGFIVQSAGLAAFDGGPASAEAQDVAREFGGSLDDHVSQSLTPQLVRLSDRLVVMTRDHRAAILSMWPEAKAKTVLLAGEGDIADPIGQGIDRYRRCAEQIRTHLQALLSHIKAGRR